MKTEAKGPDARLTRVWDPVVRLFHWSLATSFAVAWFTPRSNEELHHIAGYAAGGLVALRLAWGVIGTRHARFADFVKSPRVVFAYLLAIARGGEARFIGHNPAGGAMIVALLAVMAATAFSGWMMTTDAYFGDDQMQALHRLAADGVLALVALHLCGVALASLRHRENLVAAMLSGRKRAASDGDVD